MKKPFSTLLLVLTVFFSTTAITFIALKAEADPFPPPTTEIEIMTPQNRSYNVNTIELIFSARSISFFSRTHFYYSLDGQERAPLENVTTVSDEYLPISPGIYVKNVTGSCILDNLSEGLHEVTVYDVRHVNDDPQDEEIVYSASAIFSITVPPESYLIVPIAAASFTAVVIAVVGLLVYWKKHKREAETA